MGLINSFNQNANAQLVDDYINTAYDNVKLVADNMDWVIRAVTVLEDFDDSSLAEFFIKYEDFLVKYADSSQKYDVLVTQWDLLMGVDGTGQTDGIYWEIDQLRLTAETAVTNAEAAEAGALTSETESRLSEANASTSAANALESEVKAYESEIATAAALGLKLNLTGGTVTGQIKGITPVDVVDLVRKDYVDAISDSRVKNNPQPFEATSAIEQLDMYSWDWNDKTAKTGSSNGPIAQEMLLVLPHLVHKQADTEAVEASEGVDAVEAFEGLYYLDRDGLIGYLLQSVKELSARIKDLEAKH